MRFIREFLKTEAAGGLWLIGAALAAMMLANGKWSHEYLALWQKQAGGLSLQTWINDGLMSLFFLLIGLELKRECLRGELRQPKQAILPIMAALGGMIVPCGLFLLINQGMPENLNGWAIPAATDIAFALGVLSLLRKQVPSSMKVFLTALAIIDDMGAIAIIGLFYAGASHFMSLVAVLTAFIIPLNMGRKLEHALHPWVVFGVLPVFALANAGLDLSAIRFGDFINPLPFGIFIALVIGKPIGIIAGSWLALHLNWAIRPPAMKAGHFLGLALLGGIGFTMSLFIANLAFADPAMIEQAKLGVLSGSLLSALLAVWVLNKTR